MSSTPTFMKLIITRKYNKAKLFDKTLAPSFVKLTVNVSFRKELILSFFAIEFKQNA